MKYIYFLSDIFFFIFYIYNFFLYSFSASLARFPAQATTLILFACIDSFSNLKFGFITKKVQTSSQNLYVSR